MQVRRHQPHQGQRTLHRMLESADAGGDGMSELECMVLGTILSNQIVILSHLNKCGADISLALETSGKVLDALKNLLNKENRHE